MLHFVCQWDWQIRQYYPPLHTNTCMPLHAVPAKGSQQIMWHHEIISEISGVANLFSGNNKCVPHSSLPTLKHLLDNWCEMTKAGNKHEEWKEKERETEAYLTLGTHYILLFLSTDWTQWSLHLQPGNHTMWHLQVVTSIIFKSGLAISCFCKI